MNAKAFVTDLFTEWEKGDSAPFFAALAPDVIWTAIGTTPISGTVHGKDSYLEKIYRPLLKSFLGPTMCRVKRMVAEGDMVVVEWHGETPTTKGTYSQDYCWLIRVNPSDSTIAEVSGYFDTERVSLLFS
jgi:ketosteroid isomerase-like protein